MSSKAINAILNAAEENDIVAIGPGMGQSTGLRSVIEALIQQEGLRLLIDGDGLNNLSQLTGWPKKRKADLVLTPHPGEMKRLWSGLFREEMPQDRQQTATQVAQTTQAVTILKGAGTVVTDGERVYVNTTGNPGMGTAGAGDVLTGITSALMGQGLSNFDATVLGVYVHGLAGDLAAAQLGQVSLIATDIIDSCRKRSSDCRSTVHTLQVPSLDRAASSRPPALGMVGRWRRADPPSRAGHPQVLADLRLPPNATRLSRTPRYRTCGILLRGNPSCDYNAETRVSCPVTETREEKVCSIHLV